MPVISARLVIALTVSVPLVLWFTPIVQPMNAARALPVRSRTSRNVPNADRANVEMNSRL